MDQGRDELWRLLANKFVRDTAPPVGGVATMPATTDAEALLVRWRAQDYASGVSSYTVQYRRNGGRWRTWLSGTKKTSAWFTGDAGSTYEFRVRAVDLKGNAQSWVTVPGKPASVKAGAFARVAASTLNVRSGPGPAYGIVDNAEAGDVVYVLEGPVSAGGYQWFRVQYGFRRVAERRLPADRLDGRQPVGHRHAGAAAGADGDQAVALREARPAGPPDSAPTATGCRTAPRRTIR